MFGVINRIVEQRGFGFLRQDQHGEADIFFHLSELNELKWSPLIVGRRVSYDRGPGPNGGLVATNISAVAEEPRCLAGNIRFKNVMGGFRVTGTILKVELEKKFAWIVPDRAVNEEHTRNVFAHIKDFDKQIPWDARILDRRVSFETRTSDRGLRALNVRPI